METSPPSPVATVRIAPPVPRPPQVVEGEDVVMASLLSKVEFWTEKWDAEGPQLASLAIAPPLCAVLWMNVEPLTCVVNVVELLVRVATAPPASSE